jgi:hypothetical protein
MSVTNTVGVGTAVAVGEEGERVLVDGGAGSEAIGVVGTEVGVVSVIGGFMDAAELEHETMISGSPANKTKIQRGTLLRMLNSSSQYFRAQRNIYYTLRLVTDFLRTSFALD